MVVAVIAVPAGVILITGEAVAAVLELEFVSLLAACAPDMVAEVDDYTRLRGLKCQRSCHSSCSEQQHQNTRNPNATFSVHY